MTNRRLWRRLLDDVDRWASAREVPAGIEITFEQSPGVSRTVEVVMTPDDWESFISVIWARAEPRDTPFRSKVIGTPADADYLVYDTYDWWPSATRELQEEEPPAGPGTWVPIAPARSRGPARTRGRRTVTDGRGEEKHR
ncbi:hypothetical protein [Nocardioides renjunii]|uniref:hypothetical protein n=1 Tax=Nocardioides renjunii TaxID=3095075 RepID=UPI002AFDF147|nr:hypothetical protein [Nocardioides sp. S-34]WQQ20377.1 hypothetical protein SHK17_10675 [Nocardioides sp. S-34]